MAPQCTSVEKKKVKSTHTCDMKRKKNVFQ